MVAATTENITLSGAQTIDGVSVVAGDRVLVKNQTDASENGIYVASATAWARSADADEDDEVTGGMFVFVEEGTMWADTGWVLATDGAITVDTTDLNFAQFSGAGAYEAGNGLTRSGTIFSADFEDTDGNINAVGTADAGTSTKVARADHVHAHGNQLGGTLHANASTSSAGFMSTTMWDKLDGIASGAEVNQNAWGVVDINTSETVLTAGEDADTLKFVEAQVINIVGSAGDTITIGISPGTNDQVLRTVGGVAQWANLPEASTTLLSLTDTPSDYTDDSGKVLRVNTGETAVEFADLEDILVAIRTTPSGNLTGSTHVSDVVAWVDEMADDYIPLGGTHTGLLVSATYVSDAMDVLDDLDLPPSSATAGSTLYYSSGWVESNIIFNDHANAEVGINTQTPNSTASCGWVVCCQDSYGYC